MSYSSLHPKHKLSSNSQSSFDVNRTTSLGAFIPSADFSLKMLHSSALIFASIIGASILYIPYSVYLSGIYLGFSYLLLGMLANLFVCYCLIRVADLTDNISYYGLGEQLLGKRMGVYCEATLAIACYRKYVSYLIALGMLPGEIMQTLGLEWGVVEDPKIWVSLFCLMILPICLVNKISSLKYLPYLSVAASIVVASVIVAESLKEISNVESDALEEFSEKPYENSKTDIYPYTYPINRILLAFSCQCNVLYIYSYISFRDIPKGMTVISIGMLSVNFIYLLVSSFGYFLLYKIDDNDFNLIKLMRQTSTLAILVTIT